MNREYSDQHAHMKSDQVLPFSQIYMYNTKIVKIYLHVTDTSKTATPPATAASQSKAGSHAAGSQTVQVINQSKPATQSPVVMTHMTPGGLALRPGGKAFYCNHFIGDG